MHFSNVHAQIYTPTRARTHAHTHTSPDLTAPEPLPCYAYLTLSIKKFKLEIIECRATVNVRQRVRGLPGSLLLFVHAVPDRAHQVPAAGHAGDQCAGLTNSCMMITLLGISCVYFPLY